MMEGIQESNYDRKNELKAFDDTKAGVKGLVDSGLAKIPRIFVHKDHHNYKHEIPQNHTVAVKSNISIPIIDLTGMEQDSILRREVVEKIRDAGKKWGFFQFVNHGIDPTTLDEMMDGIRRFHEQESEVKKEFYSRDYTKKVKYNSNLVCFMENQPTGGILWTVSWLLIAPSIQGHINGILGQNDEIWNHSVGVALRSSRSQQQLLDGQYV